MLKIFFKAARCSVTVSQQQSQTCRRREDKEYHKARVSASVKCYLRLPPPGYTKIRYKGFFDSRLLVPLEMNDIPYQLKRLFYVYLADNQRRRQVRVTPFTRESHPLASTVIMLQGDHCRWAPLESCFKLFLS